MRSIEGSSRGGRGYRGRGGGRGRGGAVDHRFAARHTDPRFSTAHRGRGGAGRGGYQQNRAAPNAREAAMRSDPRFAKHVVANDDEDEEDEQEEDEEVASVASTNSQGSDSAHDDAEGKEDELDDQELAALDEDAAAWSGSDVDFCEATKRIAIVNCDWDHIRATDIYAILFHNLPLGGRLSDVKLYLSEFGKRMIEYERTHGPDLWVKPGETEPADEGEPAMEVEELPDDEADAEDLMDDDEDGADEDEDNGWVDDNPAMMKEVGEDGERFSSGKYRKYERDRMKYYYAVATFDSADTAAAVYRELDGMDIEASGVVLDLRYIEDSETFDDKPTEVCTKLPPNFKPLGSFRCAALTQSKFQISWDQDDVRRHRSIQDALTGETEEDDLAAYIAAGSSDDDDENDPTTELRKKKRDAERRAIREKFSELLADIGGLSEELPDAEDDAEDDDHIGSDDDSLNQLSDIDESHFLANDEDDDDDNEDDEDEDLDSTMGDKEATIDFDADAKAQRLQRDLLREKQMKDGDVGTKASLKYKLKRKEQKAAKRDMLRELEVARRKEKSKDELLAERAALRENLSDVIDGEFQKRSGKQKRKEHAKKMKEEAAKIRDAKRVSRVAGALGVSTDVVSAATSKGSHHAADEPSIDPRFANKLLSDPRFHLDVAQKDKRTQADVAKLATTVVKARQAQKTSRTSSTTPGSNSANASSAAADDAVDFFLSRPNKKARKQ